MKLYTYFRSSSAWRVRIALELKGLAYEPVFVHLLRGGGEQYSAEYAALNPMQQIPLLEVPRAEGEPPFRITQSVAIVEYLEEKHPDPALLPESPEERAQVRRLVEIVNSGMQPFQNTAVRKYIEGTGGDANAFTQTFLGRGLHALEVEANATAGEFLVGDRPTLADVYLVPQLFGVRRMGLELDDSSTLARVERNCLALDAFRRAAPESQPDFEP